MLTLLRLQQFLVSQELNAEVANYLSSVFDECGGEGVVNAAKPFLPEGALHALRLLAAQDQKCSATAPTHEPSVRSAKLSSTGEGADADPEPDVAATKVSRLSKMERRHAKAKAKSKNKSEKRESQESLVNARHLEDVAAFGTAETEDGLDAFDSFAVCWGRIGRHRLKNAEASRDITLPCVHLGIVTDQGQKDLVCGSSLKIMRGRRYGLIGRNGCGKTTLLRRIARRQLPGPPALRYGYVAQELVGSDETVLETACMGDAEYKALVHERNRLEKCLEARSSDPELAETFLEVVQRLDEIEQSFGHSGLEGHARLVLLGLQFTAEMLDLPTRALSGGGKKEETLQL